MDYSLLVGLHFRQTTVHGELIPSGAPTSAGYLKLFSLRILFLKHVKTVKG